MSGMVRLGRMSGFVALALLLAAISSSWASPTPGIGCECIGPSDCNGCIVVNLHKENGDPYATDYYVNVEGSYYRYCVRTSAVEDCYDSNLPCWKAVHGSLPVTYSQPPCQPAHQIVIVTFQGEYLAAMRKGCGTGK
jgi:hypothetical protein